MIPSYWSAEGNEKAYEPVAISEVWAKYREDVKGDPSNPIFKLKKATWNSNICRWSNGLLRSAVNDIKSKELFEFGKRMLLTLIGILMVYWALGNFSGNLGLLHLDYCII